AADALRARLHGRGLIPADGRRRVGEAPDLARERGHVDPTAGILAEAARIAGQEAFRAVAGRVRKPEDSGADLALAVVGVDVASGQLLQARIADDVPTGDRATTGRMGVLQHRLGQPQAGTARRFVRMPALAAVPAEVGAAPGGRLPGVVDLLPAALADVPDGQRAGQAIEREPVGVAKPEAPDLGTPRRTDERVAGRHRVRPGAAPPGVDPEDLAEQRAPVLRVLAGVTATATVAGADVE